MNPAMVGRHEEMLTCRAFLRDVGSGLSTLQIGGDAGIGKTTLWRAVTGEAVARGYRTLTATPAEAEVALPFTALGDLIGDRYDDVRGDLAEPQRRALDLALLREVDPGEHPPNPRAVGMGLLGSLTALSADQPLIIAIDDSQWLDSASDQVIAYALRRLRGVRVGCLVASRTPEHEASGSLTGSIAIPEARLHRLRLEPVSVDVLDRLLDANFGYEALRQNLVLRIHTASGGNPLIALEIMRALQGRQHGVGRGAGLPVPTNLDSLMRERIGQLSPNARTYLNVAALSSRPTVELVGAVIGPSAAKALREVQTARILEDSDGALTFSHPTVRSAVDRHVPDDERRRLHGRLADLVTDPEERARHLALAATGPGAETAADIDKGAHAALQRGAPSIAAHLWELAAELTPSDSEVDSHRRLVAAADARFASGDVAGARHLFESVIARMPPGHDRANARALFGRLRLHSDSVHAGAELIEQALVDAGDDAALQARLLVELAGTDGSLGQVDASIEHAGRALELARSIGDVTTCAEAIGVLTLEMHVRGDRDVDLKEAIRLEAASGRARVLRSPTFVRGMIRMWSGAVSDAMTLFTECHERANLSGDESSIATVLNYLARTALYKGDADSASRLSHEACSMARDSGESAFLAMFLATSALVAANTGDVKEARGAIVEGMTLARKSGSFATQFQISHSQASLDTLLGRPDLVRENAEPMLVALAGLARGNLCVLPELSDILEAFAAGPEREETTILLDRLHAQATEQMNPWALARAERCFALVRAEQGDLRQAVATAERAVQLASKLEVPVERGRALLVLGQTMRRLGQHTDARTALTAALAVFEQIGARLWHERSADELGRIGGRRTAAEGLTEAEQRVADLVAAGKSNREVAAALFVSVNTVQTTLKHVFHKVGVHSRAELAARLAVSANLPARTEQGSLKNH